MNVAQKREPSTCGHEIRDPASYVQANSYRSVTVGHKYTQLVSHTEVQYPRSPPLENNSSDSMSEMNTYYRFSLS